MIEKKTLSAFGVAIVIILIIAINPPEITFEETTSDIPDRPKNLPDKAFWIGGVDGGNFICIEKSKDQNKVFPVQIFNDYTGEIEYDGKLKYMGTKSILNEISTQSLYQGWDGESLHLRGGELMVIFDDK